MALLTYYPIILHSSSSSISSSSSSFPTPHTFNFSTSQLLRLTKLGNNIHGPLPLCSLSSPPSVPHCSSSAIFLPFLEEDPDPDPQTQQIPEPEPTSKDQNLDSYNDDEDDPILKFFKTRTANPDPDPVKKGKLSLQKNRKTAWHLAFDAKDKDSPMEENELEEIGSFNLSPSIAVDNSSTKVGGVVGEILEKSRNLPENVTLGEVLGGFEGRVSARECVEALELMGQEGLINCCLYFFEWMGLNDLSLVSPRACTILFPILGRAGLGDEIMVLFTNLPKEKRYRDVHVYNAAISGLLSCRRYDDAWKVYESMEMNNVQPDHVTCSIVITVMRKKGENAKTTWEFVEKMERKGVKWSAEVLGAIVKSFCEEGLKKEALIIQSDLEKRGISSNSIVYNTIMDAYCKSNQLEEAEGLFNEMKIKGISPTAASYNILMDAYSRRMQPEIVETLMQEMESVGLEPNVKSYTCLISAYGRQKKMSDKAADAFLKMRRVGIKPTSHSYTALIHAYSISGWHEKAYMAFESMLKEGVEPSIETYTALLDAFRRVGDTEKLMQIWKMMIKNKVNGTRVTFNILLDGFAKQGHYVEARDVVGEFKKIGYEPTVMTYNMLMNAYARGGRDSKLPQLLKEMAALKLKPDSITYLTMIYAYLRVRDFKRAFFYHKEMVKSGQVPDAKSYAKLRAILDAKAKIKNRKDKSALMGIIKSSMGLMKPKKKGKKDEFWKGKKNQSRAYRLHTPGS
ncbi:OLC1v1013450C1 [Oldenlandia corymbosa var. corymbosa]|uniref:OLC1v1013450C1 n=1 Tax=Oldenlandia corymbosa var. corymbosa TaxID=529605 RepID=A0AAV1E1W5_OLDCO|nr:OLC1v1013450C1 [Oldenlandia corymbosa var. corymbosa]